MKKHLILSLLLVFIMTPNLFSQSENIGINTTSPDNSSALHVTYVTTPKGMLIPRMTTAQRGNIPAPVANALLIFNTTTNQFEYYDSGSTSWVGLATATTYTVDQFVSTDASGNLQTFDFSQDLSATTAGVATVTGIQTRAVSNTAPTNGQVLQWDGTASEWVPTTPAGGGGGGNTLDESYDQGGAGSGRTINVTDGAVQFTSTNAADESVEITNSGNGGALLIENTGTGQTLLVNDEASDTTPFTIDDEGNVGVKTNAPTASLDVEGDFKLGDDGTVLDGIIKETVNFGIDPISAHTNRTVTATVNGATTGSTVIVNPSSAFGSGRLVIAYSWVSAADEVSIVFHNAATSNQSAVSSMDWYITVIK